MTEDDTPNCTQCGKRMSPAGFIIGKGITEWACWDCNIRTEDIQHEEVKPKELPDNDHRRSV